MAWRKNSFGLILSLVFLAAGCATLSDAGERYRCGVQAIRDGRWDFALVHLKAVVDEDPNSPYAPAATFALGEYYYDHSDYFNAIKMLSSYLRLYPKDKGVVFAKLLVYKIVTEFKAHETLSGQEEALMKDIRKELFSQPLFLMFYDKKTPRSYKSLFRHNYVVYDYVDQIKVFRDDKIFLQLAP
jgi:outer membrane protein assembly factor BamD (BamD/ComL family)